MDFETSAATKLGGRNAMVITYRVLELPGGHWSITLFIDAETMLPVQRVLTAEGKDGPVRITETCTFDLNPKSRAAPSSCQSSGIAVGKAGRGKKDQRRSSHSVKRAAGSAATASP